MIVWFILLWLIFDWLWLLCVDDLDLWMIFC